MSLIYLRLVPDSLEARASPKDKAGAKRWAGSVVVFVIGVVDIVIVTFFSGDLILILILHLLILILIFFGSGFFEFFFSVRIWFFHSLNFHVVVRTRFTVGWSDSM